MLENLQHYVVQSLRVYTLQPALFVATGCICASLVLSMCARTQ